MRQSRQAPISGNEKQLVPQKAPYRDVRRIIIMLMLASLMPMVMKAQGQKSAPRIEFFQTVYDYDTIEQNSDGCCTFTFKNTGNAPLLISNASTSCGCTKPQFSTRPVMPGRTGRITIRYNTSLVGSFRKAIAVKSNASNQANAILFIKGYVKRATPQLARRKRAG